MKYFCAIILLMIIINQSQVDGAPNCEDGAASCAITTNGCILPNRPENGYVTMPENPTSSYIPGSKVPSLTMLKFVCNDTYALVGNYEINYCVDNKWIPGIPRCDKICEPVVTTKLMKATCYKSDYDGDSEVDCNKPFSRTRVKVTCAPYYEDPSLIWYPYRVCVNGTWDRELPNCVPECGRKFVNAQPLIIGGTTPKKDQWPWVVLIYNKIDKMYLCVGSLLNQKVILSVAHCFTNERNFRSQPDKYVAAAGKHYSIYDDLRDERTAQYSDIEYIFVPPEFEGDSKYYRADIAVIVVKEPFDLSNSVKPVCVDWGPTFEVEQLISGSYGVVLSWGYTTANGPISSELKELEVPYFPTVECTRFSAEFQKYTTTGDKICGGYFNRSTSLCNGDSGAGFLFRRGDRYYIRGVVSVAPVAKSAGCDANQYALYTRVAKYNDFIAKYETRYRP